MRHERRKPLLGIFIFIMGVSPSNFVVVSLWFLLAEIAVFLVLKLLAEFQCEIDLCMMDEQDFSSIMLTFLYLSVTTENVSITSKALVGDNGSTLCSMVIPNFNFLLTFRYIRICQWNSHGGYYPNDLLRWRSWRLEMFLSWTSCISKNVRLFHTIFCSFYWKKKVLTECSDVWSSIP